MNLSKGMKLICAAALAITLAVPAPGSAAEITKLTAVGAGMGGFWTLGLSAIGKIMTTKFPGMEYKLLPGASMANPTRLSNGEGDLSITNHSMATAANAGTMPYKRKAENTSSILNIGDTTLFHMVVPANSPIKTIDDIKAKKFPLRISHGPMGSIVELGARWVLEEYGITYKDIRAWGGKTHPLSFNDAVSLFKDGHLDMFCWFGAGESAYLQELKASMDLRWIPVSAEALASISKKHGLRSVVIPAGFLGGAVKEDIPCVGDGSEFIVRKDLPEDVVYEITKLIMTNREEIVLALPAWKTISPDVVATGMGFDLHPGAVKYYKEAGILK